MSDFQYNPEKHHRQSIRMKGHDYARGGIYFVTLCAHKQKSLFGTLKSGQMVLSPIGESIRLCWNAISEHFPNAQPSEFIVMPDHMHGIIKMMPTENVEAKNLSPIPERPRGTSRTLGSVVRGFKVGVTKWARKNTNIHDVWHRNYYEMIVRSASAEAKITQYIRMNPWRCVQDLNEGLRGMGNPSLWNSEKLGVLASRGAPAPKAIPGAMTYLGGFHSPMEKEIFSRLLEHRRHIIWCPAWGLARSTFMPGVREALEENRMLILEMHDTAGNLAAAEARNRFVIQHADHLFIPHKTSGGMLDRLLKERSNAE